MAKLKTKAKVVSQVCMAEGVYDLCLFVPAIASQALPGQFLSLYCRDASRLLPRPLSLCGIDKGTGQVRLVYRIAGAGTEEFSLLKPGDDIAVLGPLGNGFPIEAGGDALLVGGGIGIPPMLALAQALSGANNACGAGTVTAVFGYRAGALFLADEMKAYGRVFVATEDGSAGIKGTVLDAIRENALEADTVYACGPRPMLRALQAWALKEGRACYLSLEERMACGVGACLGCVCRTTDVDGHSQVKNRRVCKDGPVFEAGEVLL